MSTAVLLLAAGESSRMGRPKQLLPCPGDGVPLIRRRAEDALSLDIGSVVVVLGAHADACRSALDGVPTRIVHNDQWSRGLGSSIACGMNALDTAGLSAVLLLLCDQPHAGPQRLRRMHGLHFSTGASITAARYAGVIGTPAFFGSEWFPRLAQLDGAAGAKSLIQSCANTVPFDWPEAAFDLDTPDDAERWESLTSVRPPEIRRA